MDPPGLGTPAKNAMPWGPTLALSYSALGVIYGDIGTSPLYTMASIFTDVDTFDEEDAKMGVSLIFWSLTLVVLVKYVLVVLHADDQGEGGTFALYSLLCRTMGVSPLGTMPKHDHTQLLRISQRAEVARLSRMSKLSHSSQQVEPTPDAFDMHDNADTPKACFCDDKDSVEGANGLAHHAQWWNWAPFPQHRTIRVFRQSPGAQRTLLITCIIATSMVFGDGVLTPAVSVVGAVSGLTVAPGAEDSITTATIVGISCAIIVLLFTSQHQGTARISFLFSPIVVLWLLSNAAIGIYNITVYSPAVLQGLSPHYIYKYFVRYQSDGWSRLAFVMLSVTGVEAMFADLGHFSRAAITISWSFFVYPCLVLTYLGQGAYLIVNPDAVGTAYWSAVPSSVFWPMLVLATLAGVVASQALISGCFSICKQAQALDIMPYLKVQHTSPDMAGQVYIGSVNFLLMCACVAVVAGFQADPVRLGNAYGLNISAVMLITTCLVSLVMITKWRLTSVAVLAFFCVFALIDASFVSANLEKVPHGGWIALAIAGVVSTIDCVWVLGQNKRQRIAAKDTQLPLAQLLTDVPALMSSPMASATQHSSSTEMALLKGYTRQVLRRLPDVPLEKLPGIGLFYTQRSEGLPEVLHYMLQRLVAVHQVNVMVYVRQLPVPWVHEPDRLTAQVIPDVPNFYICTARYGYMEVLDHSQNFLERLVAAVIAAIEARADNKVEAPKEDPDDFTVPDLPPAAVVALSGGAPAATLSLEIRPAQSLLHASGSVDIARVSRAIARTSALLRLSRLPTSSRHTEGAGSTELSAAAEVAALRVTRLHEAASSGVVFYFSRPSIRMKPGSSMLHDLLYDNLYKPLLLLSYAEAEHWMVPADNLLELSLITHI